MDKSDIPKIIHKYISLFDNEEAYNAAFSNFEEVNWSAIKPSVGSEETPDKYRASRRLSNMYKKNNPPDYKFDNIDDFIVGNKKIVEIQNDRTKKLVIRETNIYADAAYIAKHNTNGNIINNFTPDIIRKVFFLEIVWGVFGWEWRNYERVIGIDPETEEPITETLKGGNLYKIKEIKTVPHIIDGHRLYHINDFLNSQDKVTKVESFNTINLIAINRAFKRLVKRYGINDTITPCLLEVYQFPNVEEADDLFYNNNITIINNNSFELPKVKSADGFYKMAQYNDNLTFTLNAIEQFTNGFNWTFFSQYTVNVNDILIGNSLKKVWNLKGLFNNAIFYNGDDDKNTTINLDLSGSSLTAGDTFDLSNYAYDASIGWVSVADLSPSFRDRCFVFNLTLKGKTNLTNGFRRIMNNSDRINSSDMTQYGNYKHIPPSRIAVNFNNTKSLVSSLDYAFANNRFIEQPPVTQWINNDCSENYIYASCTLDDGIVYDFSPNEVINSSSKQFNGCTIDSSKTVSFDNVDALKSIVFQNINFKNGGNIPFPYNEDFYNSRYQYNDDATDKHREINFSGSMFTSLKSNQTIYVSGDSAKTMFEGCSVIDFTNSDIIIDVKVIPAVGAVYSNWTTFRNCSAMEETPTIIAEGMCLARSSYGDNIVNMFKGCYNLKTIHGARISGYVTAETNVGAWAYAMDLTDCKDLVYLDLGDVFGGLKIQGLLNLDLATLSATLLRQSGFGAQGKYDSGLYISRSTWTALETQYPATIAYINSFENKQIQWDETT